MDIVTTSIIAATATGVIKSVSSVGEKLVVDAYEALKAALKHKLGIDNEVSKAVSSLEEKPASEGRKETLKEEVASTKAHEDPDIAQAAQHLLEALKSQPGGEVHIQTAQGSYIAQADRSSTASVNINRPKDE
jgi:hypothetical protein